MSSSFAGRQKKLVLFDVDDTLTRPRQKITPEMHQLLQDLRKRVFIGFVSGSDIGKISEQLSLIGTPVIEEWDYAFGENGLVAFKAGQQLPSQSFIKFLGEEKWKAMVKFILHYIADLDIPVKRGTFIEFRNGLVNVSPLGRNATLQERHDFEAYDKIHLVREALVRELKKEFGTWGLTFAIGGKISFDVFPNGWDKTYALRHVEDEGFEEIHFFGDSTHLGGNDFEIFMDQRTIGHTVDGFPDTMRVLKELFF